MEMPDVFLPLYQPKTHDLLGDMLSPLRMALLQKLPFSTIQQDWTVHGQMYIVAELALQPIFAQIATSPPIDYINVQMEELL